MLYAEYLRVMLSNVFLCVSSLKLQVSSVTQESVCCNDIVSSALYRQTDYWFTCVLTRGCGVCVCVCICSTLIYVLIIDSCCLHLIWGTFFHKRCQSFLFQGIHFCMVFYFFLIVLMMQVIGQVVHCKSNGNKQQRVTLSLHRCKMLTIISILLFSWCFPDVLLATLVSLIFNCEML